MITVGMNYEIIKGKEQAFVDKFTRVIEVMSKTEGHKMTNLYQDVYKNSFYLIVSEWDSRPAFDNFTHSDAFHKVTQWGKDHILAGRPKHEVYGDN